ncbi:MAG: synthase sector subunit b [Myxococcaceae bacterium]|nr:synthase sector subunit b [Myxococcaceae bacterium]
MKSFMQRSALVLASICASTLSVGSALAQEAHEAVHEVAEGAAHTPHEAHGWDSTGLLASFVNFAVLLLLFVYLFKDSLKSFLTKRRAEIEQQLLEAARLKTEAEAKHKEYSDRLAKLDSELAQIRLDMIESGKRERDRIIAEAEHKAARMRHEAQFMIEQQVKQLRVDISREAADAAVSAAHELLLRATTTYDQQRLSQEYLTALATKGDGAGAKKPSLAPQPESRV